LKPLSGWRTILKQGTLLKNSKLKQFQLIKFAAGRSSMDKGKQKNDKDLESISKGISNISIGGQDPVSFEEMGIIGTCTIHEKPYFRLTSV
jgi:hypothetical protein